MANLVIAQPANMQLSARDWAAVESFDAPACPAVGARGGRQAMPAAPAVVAPPRLRFLENASFPNLLAPPPAPAFSFIVSFAWMLGPCLDRRSRADTGSTVYVVGQIIARAMNEHYGLLDDAGLALNLRDFLSCVGLPVALASPSMTEEELRSEIRDALAFRRSEQSRRDVEIARLHYTERR